MIEYFSANLWQVWAIIFFICLILELSSGDFFIICFSIGALFAGIAAGINLNLTVQVIIFAIASTLSIFFVRPVMLRYFHKPQKERLSNADALIGQTGRVSQEIEAGGYGRVAIDGDDWKALSADGSAIEKDARVRVVNRESIIITVERI
ncbi:MAG: NfeD family protein [Muribaculaceae bacterium]|nr:NfeD family protein [Muribaculaceae bacterium]